MAIQRGKDLLLKLDDTGSGAFVTVAGLRTRRLAFSNDGVDVTNADSPERWRELLAGAGVRRAQISGSGVFRDAACDESVRAVFFAGAIRAWQVLLPDFGTVTGAFQITALDYSGDHDGELTFELTLESAGALVFAAL
jgi:TP901-1 family phage major tail protein